MSEIERAREGERQERDARQDVTQTDADGDPAEQMPGVPGGAHTWEPPGNPARDTADTDTATANAAASMAATKGADLPNTATHPKPGAAPAWQAEDAQARDFSKIAPGWSVFSADGEELGKVERLGANFMAVPYGRTLERTMYIPQEYIESVAGARVILNQPAGRLIDMKLDAPPADFPEEHARVSGVEHAPLRPEPAAAQLAGPAAATTLPPPPVAGPAPAAAAATMPELTVAPAEPSTPPGLPDDSPANPVGLRGVPAEPRGESHDQPVGFALVADAGLPNAPQAEQDAATAHVEPTVSADEIARLPGPSTTAHSGAAVSSHMEPLPGEARDTSAWARVNAQDRAGGAFEERSGYTVLSTDARYDRSDGPTHQAGVKDADSLAPLRTPFGVTGTPGEGRERNVSDLDLAKNQHAEGSPFDSQAATVGRPLAPGEPQAAERSLPGPRGSAQAHTEIQDAPPGAVSQPEPRSE